MQYNNPIYLSNITNSYYVNNKYKSNIIRNDKYFILYIIFYVD